MKKSVEEWIKKADGDYTTAIREYRARRNPNYDSACFHGQQCIEKMLKSLLDAQDMPIAHTHDLCVLARASVARYPLVAAMRDDLELLSQYAVLFRYPGHSAARVHAREAVTAMKRCRAELFEILSSLR